MAKSEKTQTLHVPAGTQKSTELFDTIAWLRAFLSMFVVAIHVFEYGEIMTALKMQPYDGAENLKTFFESGYRAFTACAVPAFFLISGYLFFRGNDFSFTTYIDKLKRRSTSLLVPFAIFHLLALSIWLGFAKIGIPQAVNLFSDFQWYDYFGLGNKQLNNPLWFIHDLIIVVIASPIIHFFVKKIGLAFLVVAGTFLLMSQAKGVEFLGGVGIFWFSLGAFISINKIDFLQNIKHLNKWLLLSLWIFAAILKISGFLSGKTIVFAIIAIGVLTIFSWCNYFVKRWHVPATIAYLSSASMFIYCIHMPINQIIARQIVKYILANNLIPQNHFTIITLEISQFLFLFLSSLAIYAVLKKVFPRVCAILCGGR